MINPKIKYASIFNKTLSHFGLQIKRVSSGLWDTDAEFLEIYRRIKDKTCVKIDRAYFIFQFAKRGSLFTQGAVAQVGVYKGGTARIIAECFAGSKKSVFLFDTFEGLPDASAKDGEKNNIIEKEKDFADVDFNDVKAYFSDLPNVEMKKGFFPDTAKGLENELFCFVYLDTDLYQSIKDGLEFFYPRLVPGGVIVIDDYCTDTWPGVKTAVQEFCQENNIFPIKAAWWQGIIIKD